MAYSLIYISQRKEGCVRSLTDLKLLGTWNPRTFFWTRRAISQSPTLGSPRRGLRRKLSVSAARWSTWLLRWSTGKFGIPHRLFLRWEYLKEKSKILKLAFFLVRDLVYFLFFLVKILFSFFFSWILLFFPGRQRVFFLFLFESFFYKFPNSHLRRRCGGLRSH